MVASNKIASPDISRDSGHRTAHEVPDAQTRTANVSERTSSPGGAAVGGQSGDSARPAAPSDITPRQRWAHNLVLDMINANLPLARLADHLKIPFDTLIAHINTPEVQAEIDAYEALINLRARLIGEAARPISLRRLLDVLESPAPKLTGRDPEADQRTLHRHAELIRRTATTIARESRAMAPKAAPKPAPAPKSAQRTANVSERTSSSASAPDAAPETLTDQLTQKGAPSASSGSSSGDSPTPGSGRARQEVPPVPAEHTCAGEAELVRDAPTPPTPSTTPGRAEAPARQSPTDALRAVAGSTHAFRGPSRRARDHPTRPAA